MDWTEGRLRRIMRSYEHHEQEPFHIFSSVLSLDPRKHEASSSQLVDKEAVIKWRDRMNPSLK